MERQTLNDGMKVRVPKSATRLTDLTHGKEYAVIDVSSSGRLFWILDDDGMRLSCLFEGCAHINNKNWIIVK